MHIGDIFIGGETISRFGETCDEKSFKFLGHHLDENLSWTNHSEHVHKKLISAFFPLVEAKASYLFTY